MPRSFAQVVALFAEPAPIGAYRFVGESGTTPTVNGQFVDDAGACVDDPFSYTLTADTVDTWIAVYNDANSLALTVLPDEIAGVIFETDLTLRFVTLTTTTASVVRKGAAWQAGLHIIGAVAPGTFGGEAVPDNISVTQVGADTTLGAQEVTGLGCIPTNIASATTTLVLTGPGKYLGFKIVTAAAGTILVYDGVTAAGDLIDSAPASLAAGEYYLPAPIDVGTGICVVTGAATDIWVYHQA